MAVNDPTRQPAIDLAALADQCVMCGLCLPRCPTYAVDAIEGRSPRGRIAHMRRLATHEETASPALVADLGSCLSCGRCEAACPSQVRYAAMLPQARALLRARGAAEPSLQRLLRWLAKRPAWMRLALRVARRVPRRLLRGRLRALVATAQTVPADALDPGVPLPAGRPQRGRVLLLRGCVGAAVESDTHRAAATLLAGAGYEVVVLGADTCCGSLARQAGALDEAARDADAVRRRVADARVDAVVGCASGCMPALREALAAPGLPAVHELLAFLDMPTGPAPGARSQQGRHLRVALAVPCSQQALDGGAAARRALARLDGVEVVELPDAPGCCGAGAMQFIADPATAARLRSERARQVAASGADVLVTTNTGCRLHLALALAESGLDLPVLHPAAIMGTPLPRPPGSCAAIAPPTD
jgi:glycolate oxidase iron-sulfur subunit